MFASTDDSAKSLIYRTYSPIERNWNWSPRLRGTHRIIHALNLDNPRYQYSPRPYESIETDEKILFSDVDPGESKSHAASEFHDSHQQIQQEITQIIPRPIRPLQKFGFEGETADSAAIL